MCGGVGIYIYIYIYVLADFPWLKRFISKGYFNSYWGVSFVFPPDEGFEGDEKSGRNKDGIQFGKERKKL